MNHDFYSMHFYLFSERSKSLRFDIVRSLCGEARKVQFIFPFDFVVLISNHLSQRTYRYSRLQQIWSNEGQKDNQLLDSHIQKSFQRSRMKQFDLSPIFDKFQCCLFQPVLFVFSRKKTLSILKRLEGIWSGLEVWMESTFWNCGPYVVEIMNLESSS